MRYYATASTAPVRDAMRAGMLGQIVTPGCGHRLLPDVCWIGDNSVFGGGYPGDEAFLEWMGRFADHVGLCAFVVAPDVVSDCAATYERSVPMLAPIRQRVGRVAYAAQNGATAATLPWEQFDALFLGGGPECLPCGYVRLPQDRGRWCPLGHYLTEWKLGAAARALVGEARQRGLWVHMGRVNSLRRLRYADAIGVDSADGTYLVFGPDRNLPNLLSWLRDVAQPTLLDLPAITGGIW